MECNISTSASTVKNIHQNMGELSIQTTIISQPSSPRSSALPSPPDSPSESVSSLPSVTSSFFFSSAAASPPHPLPHSDQVRDPSQGLIIPSLTLPSALRRPTTYGQTLGDLKLLILGEKGAGKSFLSTILLEDNEDVVEVGNWEDAEFGSVIHASTDWIEHRDAHGLEKFEPTKNVEIYELPGYEHGEEVHSLVSAVKSIIQAPFYSVSEVLDPRQPPSVLLSNLVSSPNTPLYTALIMLLSHAPSPVDQIIIENLASHIPIIVLPRLSTYGRHPKRPKISSFQPTSPITLRAGLFRSPETLSLLRNDATDLFLKWREVERVVQGIHSTRAGSNGRRQILKLLTSKEDAQVEDHDSVPWSKAKWESDWESTLSQEVAKRLRENTVTQWDLPHPYSPTTYAGSPSFDPLNISSIVMFSLSLLGPVGRRIHKGILQVVDKLGDCRVLGGLFLGVGIGLFLGSSR